LTLLNKALHDNNLCAMTLLYCKTAKYYTYYQGRRQKISRGVGRSNGKKIEK